MKKNPSIILNLEELKVGFMVFVNIATYWEID